MSTTTEDIKAKLNIVELIGQYVRLQKAGVHWKANCPFHQEKTPSFMVNEERGMWHCFGCGKGGDAFAFVMEIEGLEFREALRMLAEKTGVELPRFDGGKAEGEAKDRGFEILELATKFYEKQLWESIGGKKILDYLHGRGLTDESLHTFRLGFAPEGWQHLSQFLLKRGYQNRELEAVGLTLPGKERGPSSTAGRHYDRFRDRIMFPIADVMGRIVGYSARVAPGGDESQAKYINTPETSIYHKSRALYGIQAAKQAMKETGIAVLVEGNMDVIALHQAGVKNTVAVSGTALTSEQLTLIKRYGNLIRLFFDMDSAGQKAAWKSAALSFQHELTVEVVALTSGKDAADMNRDDPEALRSAVNQAEPAFLYFLNQLLSESDISTPLGKRQVVERAAELLASMRNPIEQAHWEKLVAQKLSLEERIIRGIVNQATMAEKRGTNFAEANPVRRFLPKSVSRRSEVLREAIIGLMFVGSLSREAILREADPEGRTFLSLHPLFFFLQNGGNDPMSLIEDPALKQEASRLLFETLTLPLLEPVDEAKRVEKSKEIALEYWENLLQELRGKDQLEALTQKIEVAQRSGDKQQEKELLKEFVERTQKKLPTQ